MFQQDVDLMIWQLSRLRACTSRQGRCERPRAWTMGLLHARLGFGACPAHSFECISLRNVTWWLCHTSLSQPSSELLPQLLDEDRRAQPAYDAQRPCAKIRLAATSHGCSGCWGWVWGGKTFYRVIKLPIYLMLWDQYLPIRDLYFHNLLMCLCARCSWDYDSFLFIQAFMPPGDLCTSTTSRWIGNMDERMLKGRAGHSGLGNQALTPASAQVNQTHTKALCPR